MAVLHGQFGGNLFELENARTMYKMSFLDMFAVINFCELKFLTR